MQYPNVKHCQIKVLMQVVGTRTIFPEIFEAGESTSGRKAKKIIDLSRTTYSESFYISGVSIPL